MVEDGDGAGGGAAVGDGRGDEDGAEGGAVVGDRDGAVVGDGDGLELEGGGVVGAEVRNEAEDGVGLVEFRVAPAEGTC